MTTIAQPTRSTALQTWTFDVAHTLAEFSVKHMMIATVKGRFGGISGGVVFDPENPGGARIDVAIDAASIDTRVAQRDEHLRSPDFFDVANHPALIYRGHHVEHLGDGMLRIHGDLTIRGVTRHVMLSAEETGRITDPSGSERVGFTATARISRKDFGLTWNQALEAGGVMVGDEVKINLEVELVRAPGPEAA